MTSRERRYAGAKPPKVLKGEFEAQTENQGKRDGRLILCLTEAQP